MGQIQDSQLPFNDSATNGNVVDQTAWNQAFQLIKTAVNDNFYRRLASVTTLNADGTVDLTATLQAASNITNALQVQMGNGITITPTASNGTITLQFSVPSKGITASQLADLTITAQQIANQTITATQIANKTITNGQIADGTIGSTQIANAGVTLANLDTSTVDTRYYTQSTVDTKVNNLQSQINTDNTNISTNATNLTNHINSTTAHPASNITETRMGNAQSALNDLNSRLASAITSGSVSEVGDAHNSIPLSTSYATLKARLDSMDLAGIALAQKMLNSGVIDWNGTTTSFDSSHNNGDVEVIVSASFLNQFQVGGFDAIVSGEKLSIRNFGIAGNANANKVQLDAPPTSNVSPSLAGSARDDLVFLEAWRDATTSEWQWRIRIVDGVDFNTYSQDGFTNTSTVVSSSNVNSAVVTPQGGNASPLTNQVYFFMSQQMRSNSNNNCNIATSDTGLYVAGQGTSADKTTLNTYDGYSYAIPLFRVRRRNSTAFDPDTNPMGGKVYVSGVLHVATGVIGQTQTVACDASLYNGIVVGDYLAGSTGTIAYKVTALNGNNNVTVMCIYAGAGQDTYHPISDRPDGLYSNIIDASDIVDLRHQVSPTGFNYQALLEKNLDLLLRGQLTTNQTVRYSRDYIGLNTANYTDDANTLLYLKFDGSMAGTANGAAVANTKVGSGTEAYKNGVQGAAGDFTGQNYGESYNVSLTDTFTIEGFIGKTLSTSSLDFFSTNLGNALYLQANSSNGCIKFIYPTSATTQATLSVDVSNWNDWHYIKATGDGNGNYTLQVDEKTATGTGVKLSTAGTVSTVYVGSFQTTYWFNGYIDLVRVSNVVRSGTPLPSNFSYANGDRILDGPDGDFNFWSDDVGGTAGTGGRTNPYGLTHVPNQIAGRISYNGSEIRHYYGQGVTAGWSRDGSTIHGVNPTGSFESSSEVSSQLKPNETVDGTRTTFTFTPPSNYQGMSVTTINDVASTGNGLPAISSMSLNASTGVITVAYASAPANGANVYLNYTTGTRHAHFVPSTKGFIIHDWTDETHSGDGTTTVFTTTKHNVTSVNHVRVNGAIQNGGYTVGTLNQSGAGTTVTFTTAPANGATIDIVYESVITPALGDYVRVMYQHVPYQGTGNTNSVNVVYEPNLIFITSRGTGKIPSNSTMANSAQTTYLPLPSTASGDYVLKDDSVLASSINTGVDSYQSSDFTAISLKNRFGSYYAQASGIVGNTFVPVLSSSYASPTRGGANRLETSVYNFFGVVAENLPSSVPHLCFYPIIATDVTTGESYLVVVTQYKTDTTVAVTSWDSDKPAVDVFKLQGRPLIKAYGGVSA